MNFVTFLLVLCAAVAVSSAVVNDCWAVPANNANADNCAAVAPADATTCSFLADGIGTSGLCYPQACSAPSVVSAKGLTAPPFIGSGDLSVSGTGEVSFTVTLPQTSGPRDPTQVTIGFADDTGASSALVTTTFTETDGATDCALMFESGNIPLGDMISSGLSTGVVGTGTVTYTFYVLVSWQESVTLVSARAVARTTSALLAISVVISTSISATEEIGVSTQWPGIIYAYYGKDTTIDITNGKTTLVLTFVTAYNPPSGITGPYTYGSWDAVATGTTGISASGVTAATGTAPTDPKNVGFAVSMWTVSVTYPSTSCAAASGDTLTITFNLVNSNAAGTALPVTLTFDLTDSESWCAVSTTASGFSAAIVYYIDSSYTTTATSLYPGATVYYEAVVSSSLGLASDINTVLVTDVALYGGAVMDGSYSALAPYATMTAGVDQTTGFTTSCTYSTATASCNMLFPVGKVLLDNNFYMKVTLTVTLDNSEKRSVPLIQSATATKKMRVLPAPVAQNDTPAQAVIVRSSTNITALVLVAVCSFASALMVFAVFSRRN